MKKIIATLALGLASTAFAQSVSVGYTDLNNATGNDQKMYTLAVRLPVNATYTVDALTNVTHTENTSAVGSRLEAGVTATTGLTNNVKGYFRAAAGRRMNQGQDWAYYSVEPGVRVPIGAFTAGVGYRYRNAFDQAQFADLSRTMRYTISYAVTAKDSVALGFDRAKGDVDQKNLYMTYTRGF